MKTIFTSIARKHLIIMFSVLVFSGNMFAQTKHIVGVTKNVFTPNELTINQGDTVEWRNTDGFHNVNGTIAAYPTNPESFGNSTGVGWTYSHVFNISGKYDYHCNPHVGLGMIGKIEVESSNDDTNKHSLTINFSSMNPHVGQKLYLSVYEKDSGKEVERKVEDISTDFVVQVSGIEKDNSYYVDFFADHNGNGSYDAPNADHAWRLELNNVAGDTTLNFAHNTNFTDIMWKNKLTVHFTGMNPHVGQNLWLAVTDKNSGMEIARTKATVETEFMVHVFGIENGMSYNVDFFADHNGNGSYDAPNADHAWRLELNNVAGDTTLNFAHNTNFTDIMWKNKLTVHFTGMNPHVGQNLWLAVTDKNSGMEIARTKATVETEFMVHVFGIENGMSYNVDFFADHNGNGSYDAPNADHAWRLELNNVAGDTTLNFAHNTNFTDIMWKNKLTVHFTGMNPHVGQNLWLAVTDKNSGMEIARTKATVETEFMVHVFGIENGMSYNVDFFADHNGNGSYDAPNADHAWRLELNNVAGDTTLNFAHNTNFTDIMWKNKLTVHFTGMNPHVGQNLWLAVTDKNSGMEIARTKATVETEFMVHVFGIENGMSYNVDFFADHNGNGSYDAPNADHAWRLELNNVAGDTTLNFAHNTNFTDIMWKNKLTVHFTGMNPHVGQNFILRIVDKADGSVVFNTQTIATSEFTLYGYGIENGKSYNIDFYADHNGDGFYNIPPLDHAWRLELNNVAGDTTLLFVHNVIFIDIGIPTSIEEIGFKMNKIYPNPASDKVTIELNQESNNYTIAIFDIAGKKQIVSQIASDSKIELNLNELQQGLYFVQLTENNFTQTFKLIKK